MREETAVNEKFWDLKKSRQDSMINGGLRVFAENGFRHASTDEIVAEASVSKGLLFHYFYSKTGLYSFLAEYAEALEKSIGYPPKAIFHLGSAVCSNTGPEAVGVLFEGTKRER